MTAFTSAAWRWRRRPERCCWIIWSGILPRRLYFAPGPRLCHIPPQRMARIFALHPLTHLNAAEVTFFTRQHTVAAGAAVLAQATEGDVVVTLGGEGAYILSHGRARVVPVVPVTVRDTIGAGDAHLGAIMGCEALGMTLEDATGTRQPRRRGGGQPGRRGS